MIKVLFKDILSSLVDKLDAINLPSAENLRAFIFSSNELAAGLMFTNIEAFPFPEKKVWNSLVSLLSLKGITLSLFNLEVDTNDIIISCSMCLGSLSI